MRRFCSCESVELVYGRGARFRMKSQRYLDASCFIWRGSLLGGFVFVCSCVSIFGVVTSRLVKAFAPKSTFLTCNSTPQKYPYSSPDSQTMSIYLSILWILFYFHSKFWPFSLSPTLVHPAIPPYLFLSYPVISCQCVSVHLFRLRKGHPQHTVVWLHLQNLLNVLREARFRRSEHRVYAQ